MLGQGIEVLELFFKKGCQHLHLLHRYIIITMIVTVLFIIFTFSHRTVASVNNYPNQPSRTECYESVYVKAGDCLWSIATEHFSAEYKNIHHYMHRIMKINHMITTDIEAGTYLLIPYYDENL